jgi:hypothetical protein
MVARFGQRRPEERRKETETLISVRGTDVERWSEPENLKLTWARRAEVAGRLIPRNARLLDLGCGAMDLERFLDPSVTYIPADIVRRDERTLLCDLNAGELPQIDVDVITLLGVLEYVHDVARLLGRLRRMQATVICSYNPIDLGSTDRREQGWFNDLTSAGLCAKAVEAGFRLVGLVTIAPQNLYEFSPA